MSDVKAPPQLYSNSTLRRDQEYFVHTPFTDEFLAKRKAELIMEIGAEQARNIAVGRPMALVASITCEQCVWRKTCLFSYDAYNTDGDCLASK